MGDFDPETRVAAGTRIDVIVCAGCNRENKPGATFCTFCAAYLGELEDRKSPADGGGDALDGMLAKVAAENAKKAAERAREEALRPPPPPVSEPPRSRPGTKAAPARPGRPTSSPGQLQPISTPGTTSPGAVEAYRRRIQEQAARIEALEAEKQELVTQLMADGLAGGGGGDGGAVLRAVRAELDAERAKRHELTEKLLARIQEVETLREAVETLRRRAAEGAADPEALAARVRAEFRAEIEARSQRAKAELEALTRRAELAEEARDQLLETVSAPPAPAPAGPGPGDEGLREDLFGLRMLLELLQSKAGQPQVVASVTRDLLADLDKVLARLGG